MHTLTLLNAYERACRCREIARDSRGNSWGIAVDSDDHARQFQRYARIAGQALQRIHERLGKPCKYPACARCGWPTSACRCQRVYNRAFEPHTPDNPMILAREILAVLDEADTWELFKEFVEGQCLSCGALVDQGMVLCRACARVELNYYERGY